MNVIVYATVKSSLIVQRVKGFTDNMSAGRPTDYNDKTNQIALDYIKHAVPQNMDLPTMEGLADELDCDTDTLTNWAKKHTEFFGTIKKLKELQKKHLMLTGLFGGKEVNHVMAIFLLKVNHHMIETSHTDITSDGKPIYGDRAIDTVKNS